MRHHLVIAARGGNDALHQHVDAVAHERAVAVHRMRRQPGGGEGFIGGVGKVVERVEQSSVEIENGGAGSGHECGGVKAGCFQWATTLHFTCYMPEPQGRGPFTRGAWPVAGAPPLMEESDGW